jgi:hypothetical protein
MDAGSIPYQNVDIQKDEIIYYHQSPMYSKRNEHSAHSYLDLEPLQKLVQKDSQGDPIVISDIIIKDLLVRDEKDNNTWNISSLTQKQIKDDTNTRGNIIISPRTLAFKCMIT